MTTPNQEKLESDAEFDAYLQRDSAVSRQYRALNGADLPPSLDHAVLSQARAAISAQKRSRMLRWSAPLALAASVVVVVSLVMLPEVQQEVARSTLPASAPNPQAFPSATEVGREDNPAASGNGVVPIVPLPSQIEPAIAVPEAELKAAPVAKAEQPRAQDAFKERESAELDKRAAPMVVDSAAVQPPVPLAAPAPPAPPALPPVSSVPQEATASRNNAGSVSAVRQVRDRSAAQSAELSEVVVTSQNRRAPGANVGPRGTVPAQRAESKSAAASEKVYREDDPERWLEYIRELRRDRKTQLADREWLRFVAKYPDARVDDADLARAKK